MKTLKFLLAFIVNVAITARGGGDGGNTPVTASAIDPEPITGYDMELPSFSTLAPVSSPVPRFAYVANRDSPEISVYTINTGTGALTAVGTAVAAGQWPNSVTTTGTIQ